MIKLIRLLKELETEGRDQNHERLETIFRVFRQLSQFSIGSSHSKLDSLCGKLRSHMYVDEWRFLWGRVWSTGVYVLEDLLTNDVWWYRWSKDEKDEDNSSRVLSECEREKMFRRDQERRDHETDWYEHSSAVFTGLHTSLLLRRTHNAPNYNSTQSLTLPFLRTLARYFDIFQRNSTVLH